MRAFCGAAVLAGAVVFAVGTGEPDPLSPLARVSMMSPVSMMLRLAAVIPTARRVAPQAALPAA